MLCEKKCLTPLLEKGKRREGKGREREGSDTFLCKFDRQLRGKNVVVVEECIRTGERTIENRPSPLLSFPFRCEMKYLVAVCARTTCTQIHVGRAH